MEEIYSLPLDQMRERINELIEGGYTIRMLADYASLSQDTLRVFLKGTNKRIVPKTIRGILRMLRRCELQQAGQLAID